MDKKSPKQYETRTLNDKEKKYRDNVVKSIRQLGTLLSDSYSNNPPYVQSKNFVLERAYNYIIQTRKNINDLKAKKKNIPPRMDTTDLDTVLLKALQADKKDRMNYISSCLYLKYDSLLDNISTKMRSIQKNKELIHNLTIQIINKDFEHELPTESNSLKKNKSVLKKSLSESQFHNLIEQYTLLAEEEQNNKEFAGCDSSECVDKILSTMRYSLSLDDFTTL
ncbi:hypothetical protein O9G_005723 [Rozella allomycis CSF55]|uniref:BHLH domain-containing protein n=2 Tax=Rozella allomycis (strain CSF55) TaxID=988480 RepID=A0A075ASU6_ROZAC|nr:hypothetical protein O9G_005723 [Rozella allomycis CSF55]|eukprot:EPZ33361.1 hypothetical protein O9G_005723 [Rozella allomycis CSF55]